MSFVVDTPEGIELYRLIATRTGLQIEIRTYETFGTPKNSMTKGLAFRSAKRIIEEYIENPPNIRTRKQALELMEMLVATLYPETKT
jgi:hypothetical protein